MATILETPSVNLINIFDPLYTYDITFLYSGSQPVRNRAVITDVDSGRVVYDQTKDTMRLSHVIPEKSLTTNHRYSVQIQVFDVDGNSSHLSESVVFYCRTTPSFYISNDIPDPYRGSSIIVNLTYEQSEGELIRNYEFELCDYQQMVISSSGSIYSSNMTYPFYGLENNTIYYLRCIGETEHGFLLDTGYIELDVQYNTIPANILFTVDNNYCEGYISIQTNMIDIGYELGNDNYTLQDGCLTLTDNYIKYNNGFTIDGDFVLFVEAMELPLSTFLQTEDGKITLSLMDICGIIYCEFRTDNGYVAYCDLPNAQLITQDGKLITTKDGRIIQMVNMSNNADVLVTFELKRINNIYSIKAYYKTDYIE